MRLNGIDTEILDREDLRRLVPYLDFSDTARFPIYGAIFQGRAGTARHDSVAWGYARAADGHGVDIAARWRRPSAGAPARGCRDVGSKNSAFATSARAILSIRR